MMEINEEIIEIFREFKILPGDGICYLLAVFYGYKPSYIPEDLVKKVHISGIIVEKDKNIHWNIPLFEGQSTNFEWVATQYMSMFDQANPDRKGNARECIKRMKKLFSKHPEIRKDDVLGATEMYILNTDSKYIRTSHYFLEKGVGAAKTFDILEWVDKYQLSRRNESARRSNSRTLQ